MTRSRTGKKGKAGSKPAVIMRDRIVAIKEDDPETLPLTEEPASTFAASEYNVLSETASFPPPTLTSSKGKSPTRSSSSKLKTVATRADLALLNPRICFKSFRMAEHLGIMLPEAVKELWYRCDVSLL